MGRPSAFKSDEARADYCRLYDAAIALSPVPVEESDVHTSFGITHVLTAGDPSKPPLVALHAKSFSLTMWLPLFRRSRRRTTCAVRCCRRCQQERGDGRPVVAGPRHRVDRRGPRHARDRTLRVRGGVDRHLDGDALRNGTARARQTAGNAEPRRHREFTAHWADFRSPASASWAMGATFDRRDERTPPGPTASATEEARSDAVPASARAADTGGAHRRRQSLRRSPRRRGGGFSAQDSVRRRRSPRG